MNKFDLRREVLLFIALVVFAVASVYWIDIHNVKPVAAIALFGGVVFGRRIWALACPLFVLWLTVFGQTLAAWPIQVAVAGGLLFGAWAGRILRAQLHRDIRERALLSPTTKLAAVSILGSLTFFFVSNLGWWLFAGFYPPTPAGLAACLAAGLPFLVNTIVGDLCFNAVLFGAAACVVFQPIKSPIWIAFKAAPLRS